VRRKRVLVPYPEVLAALVARTHVTFAADAEDREHGDEARAPCPICGGEDRLKAQKQGGGGTLVGCQEGCDPSTVLAALGLAGNGSHEPAMGTSEGQADEAPMLGFVWAAELREATPDEPDWVFESYLAPGALTIVAGKPKAGKSTLAWAVSEAVAAQAPSFLGRRVRGGPVVYVSEEGAGTLRHKLPADAPIRILTRDAAYPKPAWRTVVEGAVAEAEHIGAVLIVIDALSFWAGLAEGQEKDSGAMQAVMDVLQAATLDGLAVLLVHHQRKAPGEDGDALRGASSIFSATDLLVEVERLGADAPGSHRRLVALSRWPAPPVLVVDRDVATGAWLVVGEAADRNESTALGQRERILRAVPIGEPGATEAELAELLELDGRKFGDSLRALVREGMIVRSGRGVRGDPYRYRRAREGSPLDAPPATGRNGGSDSPHPRRGGESSGESPPAPQGTIGGVGASESAADDATPPQATLGSATAAEDWRERFIGRHEESPA
jgi:hypothetical protein